MPTSARSSRSSRAPLLALLDATDPERPLAWRDGQPVRAGAFLARVLHVAELLPPRRHVVNLCADRLDFLVGFCAAIARGQTNLLPPARTPEAIREVLARHPGSYTLGGGAAVHAGEHLPLPAGAGAGAHAVPQVPAAHVAAIFHTSGSTGRSQADPKTWQSMRTSAAGDLAMLRSYLGEDFHVVATVPPQHMYGMELSVMPPLFGRVSVHAGQPLLPGDVAAALAELPAPRVLVTTPVHLRALLASGQALPPLAGLMSSTAPLPLELARAAETRLGAPLFEVYGSTETYICASRRSVTEPAWTPYPGVRLQPRPDGTGITAPALAAPGVLADIIEIEPDGRFRLVGRNSDMLDIAGKRGSLAELNQRLLAIEGVEDGAIFQLDAPDALGVRRLAALVVAPGRDEAAIMAALRAAVDPVFLPRPLRKVARLPRNATGKLPRAALLAMLRDATA